MKMCDRCRVSGCLLNYRGKACESARKEQCPDVDGPNRAELITEMDEDQLARHLIPMVEELCQDGVPCPEYMKGWLAGKPEEGEELYDL